MKTFVWVIAILFALNAAGIAIMLHKKEFTRNPNTMVLDILFCIAFAMWAAYLLGSA